MKTVSTEMSAANNVLKIPALPSPDPTCYGNHALGRSLAFFFSFFTFPLHNPKGIKAQSPFFLSFVYHLSLPWAALAQQWSPVSCHRGFLPARWGSGALFPSLGAPACCSSQTGTDCQALPLPPPVCGKNDHIHLDISAGLYACRLLHVHVFLQCAHTGGLG